MKRLFAFFLTALLILPVGFAYAEDGLLNSGEVILEERTNQDGIKEVFTQMDGKYYMKMIKDGELIGTKPLELMPTGLKIADEKKDTDIGEAVSNKLKMMGIYSYNLPSRLDYSSSPYLPPVGKQYENSCVGWSAGYYLRTYQEGMDLKWKVKDGDNMNSDRVFSPSFIYNQINGGTDDGALMEDAGNLLVNMGDSPLSYFPYVPGDYKTKPDSRAIAAAYPHRIRSWRILYTKNDSRDYIIQKTKEYLNTGDLMVVGINVGFNFSYPMIYNGNAIVITDNYAYAGHAVTVVGYDDNLETPEGRGAFKIINSYGKEWGNNGFGYITYDAFVANTQAGYVFTDLINNDYVPDIENLKGEPISPTMYKITFDKQDGVAGYKLLNDSKQVVANFNTNEYVINIGEPRKTVWYIQPFTENAEGKLTEVPIDTTGIVQEPMDTEITDGVSFDITFVGSGIYDMSITDRNGNLVYQKNDLIGNHGLNTVYWDGYDLSKNKVPDGEYWLKINDFPQSFEKQSKLSSADAYMNKYNGEIKSVDINLHTKEDSHLNMYIETDGDKTPLYENRRLLKDNDYNYNIDITKYIDVTDIDSAKIIIEIY